MDDGRLLPFLALSVVVGATASVRGSSLRRVAPAVEPERRKPTLLEAIRLANATSVRLSGPIVKAGSITSILAWIRWNDPDGYYPDEWDENLDLGTARAMLVSVWDDPERGSWSRRPPARGSRLRRVAPVPSEEDDPFLRGKVLLRFIAALKRSFNLEKTQVKTVKGPKDWSSLEAIDFDEIQGLHDAFPGLELGSFSFHILPFSGASVTFQLHDNDRRSMMASLEVFDEGDVTRFLVFLMRTAELIFEDRGISPYVFERGDRVFIGKNVDSSFAGRYGTVKGRNLEGGYGTPGPSTAEGEPAYLVEARKGGGALWFRAEDLRRTNR